MDTGLVSVIGFAAFVAVAAYGSALWRVLSLRIRPELDLSIGDAKDVPADVAALLESRGRELESLGFEPFAWLRAANVFSNVADSHWRRIYRHAGERVFASVDMAQQPTADQPCEIALFSLADGDRDILTVAFRAPAADPETDGHSFIVAGTHSLAVMWERHREEVAARSDFLELDATREDIVAAFASGHRSGVEKLLAQGYVREPDGSVRPSLLEALRAVVRANVPKRSPKLAAASHATASEAIAATAPDSASQAELPDVTAEVWAHRRRVALEETRPVGWLKKLGLFVLSVCAFAFAFGMKLSPETVAILFAVLLFHELGHALAMKCFGYRDLQILFVPFLGALASGKKRDVKPYQEIAMLLAGPVPGIVLGIWIFASGWNQRAQWLDDAAKMMLIVNYINLLPIMPLDGGRVMNIVLFDRFPRLQLGFSALSAVTLGLAGVWTHDRILQGLGIILLVGLPRQLQTGRLLKAARERLTRPASAPGTSDPLPALYTELRSPRYARWSADARYQAVAGLATRLLREPAGPALALVSVVAWLAVMILPLGAISYRARSQLQEAMEQGKIEHARIAAEWDAKVAAAPTPLEQARVHLDAAAALFDESQLDDVTRHVEAAAPLLTPADRELEATRQLLLGKLAATRDEDEPAPHGAEAARHFQRALDLREQLFGPESLEVAEVLEATPRNDPSDRAAALVRDLRLTSIYERAFAGDPEAFAEKLDVALQEEAFVRIETGDPERGEAALQRAAEVAGHARGEQRPGLENAALASLSDFYFEHERYLEVRAVLERRARLDLAASGSGRIGMDVYVENDRCWLEYWESNFAGARDCFSGLRARVVKVLGPGPNGRMSSVPYLIDQLAATARAGDDAEVRRLLAEARSSSADRESPVAFDQYAAMLLRINETSDSSDAHGEFRRRADERRRVLDPILAPAEARETP